MSRKCEICGKGTVAGNNVPRKGQAKKAGGVGQHIGVKSKRVFRPNIIKMRAKLDGSTRNISICTRCLRSAKVEKV